MDAEPNPIDEQLDMLAGCALIYGARLAILRRKALCHLSRRDVRELFELNLRLAQIKRDTQRLIDKIS
jgi:hypothetical protein